MEYRSSDNLEQSAHFSTVVDMFSSASKSSASKTAEIYQPVPIMSRDEADLKAMSKMAFQVLMDHLTLNVQDAMRVVKSTLN